MGVHVSQCECPRWGEIGENGKRRTSKSRNARAAAGPRAATRRRPAGTSTSPTRVDQSGLTITRDPTPLTLDPDRLTCGRVSASPPHATSNATRRVPGTGIPD